MRAPRRPSPARPQRGAGTLLVSLVLLLLLGLSVAVAAFGALRAGVVRLQGAADLAALAGADARVHNRDACDAARQLAGAGGARVVRCEVVGDEVEFVVTVTLEAPASVWPVGALGAVRAHANAGVVISGAEAEG